MKRLITASHFLFSLLLAAWVPARAAAPQAPLQVRDLRCEYRTEPLGIGTPRPLLSWKLSSAERDQQQQAFQVLVAAARAQLDRDQGILWDSGKQPADGNTGVLYGGQPLQSVGSYWWKVRVWDRQDRPSPWSAPSHWTMGLLRPEDWQARWIASPRKPDGDPAAAAGTGTGTGSPQPAPLFRKAFVVRKPVQRALLFVAGLGFHEVHLNGGKVGSAVLQPGWTNYRRRCLYESLDVSARIRRGPNALAVLLGNGMYHVPGGRYTKFKGSFGEPMMILALHLDYADGTSEVIGSDDSWKVTASPIVFNCIFGGEDYDARQEPAGWNQPQGDDSLWRQARIVEGPGGILSSQSAPASQVMQSFSPVRIHEPAPGKFVYDLGQNFSGWPALRVRGPKGSTVKLIPGERVDAKGLVTQKSSGGPMWFSYTLSGKGVESWEPRFSYYGFRYLQVEGAVPASARKADRALPRIQSLQGKFVYSSAAPAGEFSCSSDLLNRIHALILAAMRSNLQSVLTDCPHREKLGWLEVSHLLAGSLMFNFELPDFYAKIQNDMEDAQLPDGLIPDIAPEFTVFKGGFRDSPEWGSAFIITPWLAYQRYGDRRPLAEHYEAMKKYLAYLDSKSKELILTHGLGDWYDIGPKPPGVSQLTSPGVTATAVYYQDARIMEKTARLLGKEEEAKQFGGLAERIRTSFHRRFFQEPEGFYDRDSQTANAMPLALGMADAMRQEGILARLGRQMEQNGHRVSAGDVGFDYLVQALSAGNRDDLIFEMAVQSAGPGYAYQLSRGATSLTEAWDANPASSQNHCMLGHVEEWFYRGLAGIQNEEAGPGFLRFRIQPKLVEKLNWVKASHHTVRGRIGSEWQREPGRIRFSLEIPPGTVARFLVPAENLDAVEESGRPAAQAKGVHSARMEGGLADLELGSGQYRFVVRSRQADAEKP